MRHLAFAALFALTISATAPHETSAQERRGRDSGPTERWAPPAVGVRAGFDQRANAEVLGAHGRIPILRSGIIELVPTAEMAFLRGAKDYQYGVEAAWVPAGTGDGVLLTGGVAWRDTPVGTLDAAEPRRTHFGWVLGAGGRAGVGRLQVELSLRWVFLDDAPFQPNPATIGVAFPFWQVGPRGES